PGGDLLQLSTAGDVSLASTSQRRLVAYDARGARMWAVSFPDVVLAAPTVVDGDLLVASLDGTLRRIRIDTGETVWSVALRTDVASAPAVVDDAVVVVDRGGNVIARELETGAARWSTELVSGERVAAVGGVLAVQGTNSDVWVLDPADGSPRWTDHHPGI
ncbi:PQQ-binding-like beta-propeller repeat protein, partial [Schumannella luteola]